MPTTHSSATSLHLTLENDLGQLIASFFWFRGNPDFVGMVAHDGRLLQPQMLALREYCTAVLARMEEAPCADP